MLGCLFACSDFLVSNIGSVACLLSQELCQPRLPAGLGVVKLASTCHFLLSYGSLLKIQYHSSSTVRTAGYWPEGQRFKPQHLQAAAIGPMCKALNPLCFEPSFLTCWQTRGIEYYSAKDVHVTNKKDFLFSYSRVSRRWVQISSWNFWWIQSRHSALTLISFFCRSALLYHFGSWDAEVCLM